MANRDIPSGHLVLVTHVWNDKYRDWVNVNPNCLYNHSKINENSEIKTEKERHKTLHTTKDIKEGEELFVDYTKDLDLEQPEEGWKE